MKERAVEGLVVEEGQTDPPLENTTLKKFSLIRFNNKDSRTSF